MEFRNELYSQMSVA